VGLAALVEVCGLGVQLCVCVCVCAVRPDDTLLFAGNLTHPDHFHEMLLDGDSLIVGARYVYRPYYFSDLTCQNNLQT